MSALFFLGIPRRRRRWKTLLSLLLFASLAAAAIGCAGTPAPPANPGTTPGAYVVTVTGTSGAVTQSTTVTVAVN